MTYKSLKMIAVSEKNYLILKGLGRAGDSFNDVITEILKLRSQHICLDKATDSEDQKAVTADTTTLERDYTTYE
jgi:predicted CopG family antitoxin